MNRRELDSFVTQHQLPLPAVEIVFSLVDARPTPLQTKRFVVALLQLAGVLSLAAGVVFFIAANWSKISVVGRFALLEALLLVCIAAALFRPPPAMLGRLALLGAFITTGALLALFGQSYQTGADVYELFFTWALLGLPLVFASRWSVVWGAWVAVSNTALLLFCGWVPDRSAIWILFAIWGFTPSLLLLLATFANFVVWAIGELLVRKYATEWISSWLLRLLIASGIGFGTWAGFVALLSDGADYRRASPDGPLVIALYALMVGALAIYVYRRRRDVFPLAAISASAIALITVAIGKSFSHSGDLGVWFSMAVWLVASSTLASKWLMRTLDKWREFAEQP